MFCLNCGKQLKDGAVFCGECGQRVQQPAPPVQETIIVPEVPVEPPVVEPEVPAEAPVTTPEVSVEAPVQKQSTMDRPTVIVPEIPVIPEIPVEPEQDPLQQMYPEKPEKKSKVGLIIGLVAAAILLVSIAVVVVLGVMNDWWRTAPDKDDKPADDEQTTVTTTAPADPEPEGEPTADELRDSLEEYYGGGLYFYLSDDFKEKDRDDNGLYFKTRDVKLYVRWGWLDDVDSSAEYAKQYKKELDGEFESLSSFEKNDITYMIIDIEDNDVAVVGFYVQDGYGWIIEAYTDEFDKVGQDLINYVTLGVIDEDFEAPENMGTDVQREEMGFAGLYLNLDSTFEITAFDEYAFLTREGMELCIQLSSLTELGADSSEAFAELYKESMKTMDWDTLEIQTDDDEFYYVLMIGEDGLVNVVGAYIYEETAWVVTGETRDRGNATDLLITYMTTGRVEPSEIPEVEEVTSGFMNGLTLPLEGGYKEVYRDKDYVLLTNGIEEIYIFTGMVEKLEGTVTSSAEFAQLEYEANLSLWDNVRLYTVNGISCLVVWDNGEDSVTTAYAYYVAEGHWWVVQVRKDGEPEDELVDIISKGTINPSEIEESTFQRGELAQRDRITLEGQSTAEYYGLQISFNPEWKVDETFGPTGDYNGEMFTMMTNCCTVEEAGTGDALEYAWLIAEGLHELWDNYEVGKAGGVPYVLLFDDDSNTFLVIGAFANSESCWEIQITCDDPELLDEAIWYATAGVIL